MSFPLRILLVDNDQLVLSLLSQTLETEGFDVVGVLSEASAVAAAKTFDPDLAVIDVDLGDDSSGVELANALRRENPALGVLFLTNVANPKIKGYLGKLPEGSGYLIKQSVRNVSVLLQGIRNTVKGAKALPKEQDRNHPLSGLTRTQLEVLKMVAEGYSNEAISQARKTSIRAVRQTLARAQERLGLDATGSSENRVLAAIEYLRSAGHDI
jgi:DNA-binding NarL/FixJ family response regulator